MPWHLRRFLLRAPPQPPPLRRCKEGASRTPYRRTRESPVRHVMRVPIIRRRLVCPATKHARTAICNNSSRLSLGFALRATRISIREILRSRLSPRCEVSMSSSITHSTTMARLAHRLDALRVTRAHRDAPPRSRSLRDSARTRTASSVTRPERSRAVATLARARRVIRLVAFREPALAVAPSASASRMPRIARDRE